MKSCAGGVWGGYFTGARTLAFPRITSYASSTEQRPEWGLEATMVSLMKVPDFDPL